MRGDRPQPRLELNVRKSHTDIPSFQTDQKIQILRPNMSKEYSNAQIG